MDQSTESKEVWIIDGVAEDIPLMTNALSRRGYTTKSFRSAPSAIKSLEESVGEIHCIILGFELSGEETGIDFLRQLHSKNGILKEKPPVIMVTGKGSEQVAVEAMKLGVIDYIDKKNKDWIQTLPLKLVQAVVHKEISNELKELKTLTDAVFENSFDSILIIDLDGKIILANSKLCDLTQYSKEECLSISIDELFSDKNFIFEFKKSLQNKSQINSTQTTILSKFNEEIPIKLSASLLEGYNRYTLVLTDLRLEKRLAMQISEFRKFSSSHMYMASFKVGENGPEIVFAPSSTKALFQEETLQKMGIYYSVSLGQGDSEHSGVFGPMSVPEFKSTEQYVSLMYSFMTIDPSNNDVRSEGKSYTFITVTLPESLLDPYNKRLILSRIFTNSVQGLKTVDDINEEFLQKIKDRILAIEPDEF